VLASQCWHRSAGIAVLALQCWHHWLTDGRIRVFDFEYQLVVQDLFVLKHLQRQR
jgi:hypothetical protein